MTWNVCERSFGDPVETNLFTALGLALYWYEPCASTTGAVRELLVFAAEMCPCKI